MSEKNIPKVSKVKSEDLKIGQMIEQREHPWASPSTARKIAKDHISENPSYYAGGCGSGEKATVNIRIKQVHPKKKEPPKPPSNAPDWLNTNFRIWG